MAKKLLFKEHIYDDVRVLDGIFNLYSIPKIKKITEMRRDLYFEGMDYATNQEKIECFIIEKNKVSELNKNIRNIGNIKLYALMKTFGIDCAINAFDKNIKDAKIVLFQGHILSKPPNALHIIAEGDKEYYYIEYSQK